jgi:hypothetical protein
MKPQMPNQKNVLKPDYMALNFRQTFKSMIMKSRKNGNKDIPNERRTARRSERAGDVINSRNNNMNNENISANEPTARKNEGQPGDAKLNEKRISGRRSNRSMDA